MCGKCHFDVISLGVCVAYFRPKMRSNGDEVEVDSSHHDDNND